MGSSPRLETQLYYDPRAPVSYKDQKHKDDSKYFFPFGPMWAKYRYPEEPRRISQARSGLLVYRAVVLGGALFLLVKEGVFWAVGYGIAVSFLGMVVLKRYYRGIGLQKLHD